MNPIISIAIVLLTLPTFQNLAPKGTFTTMFSRPLDVAVSGQGIVAIKASHGLVFVDGSSGKIVQTLALVDTYHDYLANLGGNGLVGIAWSDDGGRVWSADGYRVLKSASRRSNGRFAWDPDVKIPGPSGVSVPVGVAMGDGEIFVAASADNAVFAVDANRRRVAAKIHVGVSPFALLRAGSRLYVTNLGGSEPRKGERTGDSGGVAVPVDARGIASRGSLSVVDLTTRRVVKEIELGREPEAMALSRDGSRLFVLNANDDTISVVDTASDDVLRTVDLPLQAGFGASPSAIAVSPADGRIYVAEGGDDRVLLLDGDSYAAMGQFATGWYPDGIAFGTNGHIYVTSLKGWGSRGREFGFSRKELTTRLGVFEVPTVPDGYNVYDYAGLLQTLHASDVAKATTSVRAFASRPFAPDSAYLAASVVPVPVRSNQRSPFAHVVYIIKENHTYDDFFGDVVQGNGDKLLCVFPKRVTPNHHALAREYGLFDNFYVNGTMSGDGHQWTDEAATTDYVERNTASWARTYPSDGTDPLAYPSTGFIWQRVLDAGLTFRDYGEFVVSGPQIVPPSAHWMQFWNDRLHGTHFATFKNSVQLSSLKPYVDDGYPGFSLRIPDQMRADEFLRELGEFSRRGSMPSLSILQLPNDHTAGSAPKYPVPAAAVADNDYALGRIVEGIAHSPFWTNTVIFVVEDDAQDGFDHVDGHRTAALVISAYNRAHFVDSHFYNQTSILRTIEAILHLRPLTQFDANASLIVAPFGLHANAAPYTAVPNDVPLDELNPDPKGKLRHIH